MIGQPEAVKKSNYTRPSIRSSEKSFSKWRWLDWSIRLHGNKEGVVTRTMFDLGTILRQQY